MARGGLEGLRVDHPVWIGNRSVLVTDERVVESLPLGLGDVVRPTTMRLDRVDTHTDELGVAFGELVLAMSEVTELGGAHRREVGRMGEQELPAVAEVLVQAEPSLGRLCGEVRGGVANWIAIRPARLIFSTYR